MKMRLLFTVFALLGASPALAAPSSPAQSVSGFYRHYLAYLKTLHGKSRSLEAARDEDRAATEKYLTPRFAVKRMAAAAHCAALAEPTAECDRDPFFCAQEAPASFAVKRTSHTTDTAWVLLEMNFGPQGKREVRVRVDRSGARWLIDRVRCPKK